MTPGPVLLEGPTVEAVEPAAERPVVVAAPRLGGAARSLILAAAVLGAGLPPGLFGGGLGGRGRCTLRRGESDADRAALEAAEAKRARKAARRRAGR